MTTPDDTAARILTAAEELLGEVGHDGVSVRDVARRAGVNKALVFYHFGSKAGLFERVLDRYYAAHTEALATAFAGEGGVRERFHRMLDAYLDFIAENWRYPRLIQALVASGHADVEQIQRLLAPLFRWIERALADLTPPEGPLAARHFFVTFSGMVINYFTYAPVLGGLWGSDPLSPEGVAERREHLRWLVDTLLDGLPERQ